MTRDYAREAMDLMPRERLLREALRAHKALERYGKHDADCSMDEDGDNGPTGNCDCGLDAACYSPFLREPSPS